MVIFNEITSNEEKSDGRDKPARQMRSFRDMISDCDLIDIGSKGQPYYLV